MSAVVSLSFLAAIVIRRCLCDCNTPIAIPITNVGLANGAYMRGVYGQVGTPAQNISFYPTWSSDVLVENTTINGNCSATDLNFAQCITMRGGLYSFTNSSTAALGSQSNATDQQVFDSLALGGTTLSKFPLVVGVTDLNTFTYESQAVIGMSNSSTLLTAATNAGQIAARSWSYWWGLPGNGGENLMDGQMVLGGYDKAKVSGQKNYTLEIGVSSNVCDGGMIATVNDITLDFVNDTHASILNGAPPFSACLNPNVPFVASLPNAYFNTFQSLTGTRSIGRETFSDFGFWGMLYSPSDVFSGNITFTFGNGAAVTVPNEVLVVSPLFVDTNGRVQANRSVSELLIDVLVDTTANMMPWLGKQFFSAAHLYVNYDAGSFTVSQVNPTTISHLVSSGGSNCNNASGSTTNQTNEPNSTLAGPAPRPSLGPGNIAGIVVGCVAGIAAVAVILVMIWKRRHRFNSAEMGSRTTRESGAGTDRYRSELDAHHIRHEMSGVSRSPQELPNSPRIGELMARETAHETDGASRDITELGSP